jgi:hypothetical protein
MATNNIERMLKRHAEASSECTAASVDRDVNPSVLEFSMIGMQARQELLHLSVLELRDRLIPLTAPYGSICNKVADDAPKPCKSDFVTRIDERADAISRTHEEILDLLDRLQI